ncbi:MAG: hypothetical protein HON94_11070 [Methylococcales bacterium]|nr:hypothetical protein [Methylococcales bacterium]
MQCYWVKLIFISGVFALAGCGGGGESGDSSNSGGSNNSGGSGNISSDFQGQWMVVHNGEKTFLGPNTQKSITVIDDNLIQDNDSSSNPYLVRAGINEVTTNGQVNGDSVAKSFKAFSGVAGIDIILKNINDSSVNIQTSSQSSGDFSLKAPSGSYTLTATDTNNNQVTTNVTIENKAIDLGEFTVVNKSVIAHNFKSEIVNNEPQYFGTLEGQTDITYSKTLQITNIGSEAVSGVTFTLSMNNSAVRNFTFNNVIVGMEPGASTSIPISFSFKRPDVDTDIPLNITLKDRFDNEWTDHTTLKLMSKSESVEINVQVTGATGHIITPGRTPRTLPAIIPYKAGDEYEIVLSALNSNDESVYSLGVGVAPGSTANFNEPNKFEPDDHILQANEIGLYETKTSFLFGGDIDFYKLKFTGEETPFDPRIVGTVGNINAKDVFVSENFAYVADSSLPGLIIVDVSSPTSPVIVGSVKTARNGNRMDVFFKNNIVYIIDDYVFQVIDVSTPTSPSIISSLTLNPSNTLTQVGSDLIVIDNHAYIGTNNLMTVVNVSTPTSLQVVDSITVPTDISKIVIEGNFAYILSGSSTASIEIYDITSPSSLTKVSSINFSSIADYGIDVNGNFLYVMGLQSSSGLFVFDISSPSSPKKVAFFNTQTSQIVINNNHIYSSTSFIVESDLSIINISSPTLPVTINSNTIPSSAGKLHIVNNFAYGVNGDSGLKIIQLK